MTSRGKISLLTAALILSGGGLVAYIVSRETAPVVSVETGDLQKVMKPQKRVSTVADPEGTPAPEAVTADDSTASATPAPPPALATAPAEVQKLHEQAMRRIQSASAERRARVYAALFDKLKLNPAQREKALEILGRPERMMAESAEQAIRTGSMPTPPSPQELNQVVAQGEQDLRSLLGTEGAQQVKDYQSTLPERALVETLRRRGVEFTADQSTQLVQVMSEERTRRMSTLPATLQQSGTSPAALSEAMRKQSSEILDASSLRLSNVLTAEQIQSMSEVMGSQSHAIATPAPLSP